MTNRILAAAVAALVSLSAQAASKPKPEGLVSVFRPTSEGKISETDLSVFWEILQGVASDELTPYGFTVLTGETSIKLLADNGISEENLAKACSKGTCPLDIARELKVKLFITSIARRMDDGSVSTFVRMYSGETGQLLASTKELSGNTFREVKLAFEAETPRFISKAIRAMGFKPLTEDQRRAAEEESKKRREAEEQAKREEEEAARKAAEEQARKADEERKRAEAEAQAQREQEERARREEQERREEASRPRRVDSGRRMALRAGLGSHLGVMGGGFEYRMGHVAVAVGFGSYLSGGLSLNLRGDGTGGPYLDLHAARTLTRQVPTQGFGATVGYDFRFLPWLSLKAGVGAAYSNVVSKPGDLRLFVIDAAAGVVF